MSLSRNQIINWLREIDITGKTVLDAGSGEENNYAKRWTKGVAKEYDTLDIDKEFKSDIVYDLNEDITKYWFKVGSKELDPQYDIIFCLEVFEHLFDPITAIKNLYWFLKPDGVLYISVPFINPIHDTWDYLRYTGEWFKKVLPQYGFKEVEIERRVGSMGLPFLLEFYKAEGMRMSKIRLKKGEAIRISDIGYLITARKRVYTGFKDKNGKEIYKGDILRCLDVNGKDTGIKRIIVFQKGIFLGLFIDEYRNQYQEFLKGKDLTANYPEEVPRINAYSLNCSEIIGNVCENPARMIKIKDPYNLKRCRNCGKHLAEHLTDRNCLIMDDFMGDYVYKQGKDGLSGYYVKDELYKKYKKILDK